MNKRFKNKVQKTLVAALDQLQRGRRWIKGSYTRDVDGVPCFCALGAIYKATKKGDCANGVQSAAVDVVQKHIPLRFKGDLVLFNDSVVTTYRDVSRVFRKAIKSLA